MSDHWHLVNHRIEYRPGSVTDQMLPGWSYTEWIQGWRFVPRPTFVSC